MLPQITAKCETCDIGNPILRKKAKAVRRKEGVALSKVLRRILLKYREITGAGRGLAAPQIGENKAVFVTFLNDGLQTYINPQIIYRSKKTTYYRESCLSSNLLWADIKRPEAVTLQWMDENGRKIKRRFTGLPGRVIQHEYDHLQGVLNLDRGEPGSIEFVQVDVKNQELRGTRGK